MGSTHSFGENNEVIGVVFCISKTFSNGGHTITDVKILNDWVYSDRNDQIKNRDHLSIHVNTFIDNYYIDQI